MNSKVIDTIQGEKGQRIDLWFDEKTKEAWATIISPRIKIGTGQVSRSIQLRDEKEEAKEKLIRMLQDEGYLSL